MSHTPGPWCIDDYGKLSVLVDDGTRHPLRICVIRGWSHLTSAMGMHLPETEANAIQYANAFLIAAAPDLLAALKEVVALSDRNQDAWNKAHAAIAKAEGK